MALAPTNTGSVLPSRELQQAVRAALRTEGEGAVVARTGMSRTSLAKLAAGLWVRKGTAALAAVRFGLDANKETPAQ